MRQIWSFNHIIFASQYPEWQKPKHERIKKISAFFWIAAENQYFIFI